MSEQPPLNLLTHYLFENPWPLGIVLLALAAIVGWMGLREGLHKRMRAAMVLGALGVGVIAAGLLLTTAAEQGERVTRELVEAVVKKDLVGGLALFSDDAIMNAGSPQNPGRDMDFIRERFSALADHYTIESNRITRLQGYSVAGDEAEVRLACITTMDRSPYPNASQWIIRLRRMPDGGGGWKITRLTCVSINNNPAPPIDQAW